jgi:hypothetical protein
MAKIMEKHEADVTDQGRSVGKIAETEKCSDEQSFGLTSSQELTPGPLARVLQQPYNP